MLSFACYSPNRECRAPELRGAHLVGIDGVPVRGELRVHDNIITCDSRNQEALGLSVLWNVEGYGTVQLQTTRLPTRNEPYNLHLELARHRLMRISMKREEWGLFDYPGVEQIAGKIDESRKLFVQALQRADDPREAAVIADRVLALAMQASEELCRFHATVFLTRRKQTGGFAHGCLGVSVTASAPPTVVNKQVAELFDFVRLPFVWRDIQSDERHVDYDAVDKWTDACGKAGMSLQGGPILNFGVQSVPDWIYAWENDYEAIANFAREHVRRSVRRYADKIQTWVIASGLHADNVFSFSFEQIIDLTRTAATVAKQAAPHSRIVIDLTQPWGEYFARNQRTAPPLLYAEMAAQSGIPFDALGLQFVFGIDSEGFHVRDMLQISSLIDRLANLGKPLHVTAAAVPSDKAAAGSSDRAWSEDLQAEWFTLFSEVALSKPYVDSVCLQTLTDGACTGVPSGGVLRADLTPKPVFDRLTILRKRLAGGS